MRERRLRFRVATLVTFFFLFALPSMSQGTKEKGITMEFRNEDLPSLFKRIEKASDFRVIFIYEDVSKYRSTGKITNATVDKAMKAIIGNHPLKYHIDGKFINVSRKQVKMLKEVKGKVLSDNDGHPVPGATVAVEGTQQQTITDANGVFTLSNVYEDMAVKVSFVGMLPQRKRVSANMTIMLKDDFEQLSEVVVTGYGNTVKGNFTGAATTLKASELNLESFSSVDQMLQGLVPGMMVKQTTGMVGASPKIRVRGTSSLLGSQNPVWVVDGVVQRDPQPFNSEENTKFSVDNDDITQLAGNAISWLNPSDIETITVLKDPSATAIYGSEAANGVIVITTKKANSGKLSVSYNGDFSIGQRPGYGLYNQMNSQEIMQLGQEMYEDRVSYPSNILPVGYAGLLQSYLNKNISKEQFDSEYYRMSNLNTDWFSALFRNSFSHKHNVSLSGGTNVVQNRTSLSFTEENGEAKGNDNQLFSATSNTTMNLLNDKLKVNLLLTGTYRKTTGFAYGVDPFNYAYGTSRAIPLYNADGTLYYHEKWADETSTVIDNKNSYKYNILNELNNTGSQSITKRWGSTLSVNWNILPGLEYQGLFSYNSLSTDTKSYATERSFYATSLRGYEYGAYSSSSQEIGYSRMPFGGLLETGFTDITTITVRNALVYDKLINDVHRITAQIGIETNTVKTRGTTSKRYGYLKDRGETFANLPIQYIDLIWNEPEENPFVRGESTVLNKVNNKLSEYAILAYTYDNRYVVNLNARLDASNRFGQDKNKRFEPTWSAGVKWRIGSEKFANNISWINNLDIIASYGYQGNSVETVSPYLIAKDGGVNEYYNDYILTISSLPYPDLGWEKTKTYNFGIDATFFDGRLNLTANYFRKVSDVLTSRNVPFENGVQKAIVGGGEITNSGYDFVVNVVPIRTRDFSWQVSLNTSVTKNTLEKNQRVNTLNDYINGTAGINGEAYSTFYSYKFKGLNESNGQPEFEYMEVENGEDPRAYLVKSGKFLPDFNGGLNMQFKYKAFTLYALFNIQWGGHGRLPKLYDTSSNYGIPTPEQNVSRDIIGRWRKPGDNTLIPSIPTSSAYIQLPSTGSVESSESWLYDMYNNSDVRVAKTDFIRCNSLSLAYDFDERFLSKIHAKRLQLKFTLANPFLWVSDSKWNGIDPETGNWPARRMATMSLKVMF